MQKMMNEFTMKLAGIPIHVKALYPKTMDFCGDFKCDDVATLEVKIDLSDIAYERNHAKGSAAQYNDEYLELLIQDYLSLFKVKPKKWYQSTLDHASRNEVIRRLSEHYQLNQDLLYRYGIIEKIKDGYLVVIYKDMKCDMKVYEDILC